MKINQQIAKSIQTTAKSMKQSGKAERNESSRGTTKADMTQTQLH